MTLKLLTEHHLEFLSLNGGCTGSSESIHVKMPHSWKSHVTAPMCIKLCNFKFGCRFTSIGRKTFSGTISHCMPLYDFL